MKAFKAIVLCSVILGNVFFNTPAFGNGCFSSAAERYSVPEDILRGIARVESSGNFLAVNISGKSYWPDTAEEAITIIIENSHFSFDIGMMQINRWWFDKFDYPYEWGFHSCWNVNFGAYILGYELSRAGGDLWKAVGRYHSPKIDKGAKYVEKVKTEVIRWQNQEK